MSNRHNCRFYENFLPQQKFDSIEEEEKLNLLERLIKIPRSTSSSKPLTSIPLSLSLLSKKSLWTTEEYYLVAVLYDASMIDRRRFWMRSIFFEISIGNAGNKQFGHSQCFEDEDKEGIRSVWTFLNKMIRNYSRVPQQTRRHSPPFSYQFLE